MMDLEKLNRHEAAIVNGHQTTSDLPADLASREAEEFAYCLLNQCRLEQVRILQDYVEATN